MKVAQMQGICIGLIFTFSLLALLHSTPSFTAQMDVEGQTGSEQFGPSLEHYKEWNELEELFTNARVDETWTIEEFEQAIAEGKCARDNYIGSNGILHLIEVETGDTGKSLKFYDGAKINGFKFKGTLTFPSDEPRLVVFRHCSFEGVHSEDKNLLSNEESCPKLFVTCYGCDFSHSSSKESNWDGCLDLIRCNLSHSSFNNRSLRQFNMRNCNLSHSSFDNVIFKDGLMIEDCNLYHSTFKESLFGLGGFFYKCDLSYSSFQKSNFAKQLELVDCSFRNTNFEEARIQGLIVKGNAPYNASFLEATIQGMPILNNCTIKLSGPDPFNPDINPFIGSSMTKPVGLIKCRDLFGHSIHAYKICMGLYLKPAIVREGSPGQRRYVMEED